jgi:hypothetical protein
MMQTHTVVFFLCSFLMMTINVTWRSTILLILGRIGLDHDAWRASQSAAVIFPCFSQHFRSLFFVLFKRFRYLMYQISTCTDFLLIIDSRKQNRKKDYLVNFVIKMSCLSICDSLSSSISLNQSCSII